MSFDPELFGQAMGDAIIKAVQPLKDEIARLKAQLAELPQPLAGKDGTDGRDGRDCDMEAVKKMIDEAVKSIQVVHGKDGVDGKDGEPGAKGEDGQKGADGLGMAGAMIDREGALLVTMSNGEVKNLGPVVGADGRDGSDGKDGADGIGFDAFELEYLDETHEVRIKASCAGRVKEIRYPAGGIRPGGYWREGTKAKAGEAWVHDGSLWIAKKDTPAKPDAAGEDWVIAARKGRDGERGQKGKDATPEVPIKLKDKA